MMKTSDAVFAHISSRIGPPPGDFSGVHKPDYREAYDIKISKDLSAFSSVEERNDRIYDHAYILGLSEDSGYVMLLLSSMGKYACMCRTGLLSAASLIEPNSKNLTAFESRVINLVESHGYEVLSADLLGRPTKYVSKGWFEDIDGPMQVCHVLFSDAVSWFNLDEFKVP